MKKLTFGLMSVALVAIAMAQSASLIRFDVKADSSDNYVVESTMKNTMNMPTGGEQDMTIKSSMKYALKYGAADKDGKHGLDMTVTDIKMDMEGPMAEMAGQMGEMPKEMKFDGKIDNRYRVTELKQAGASQNPMLAMMGSSMNWTMLFVELPEKEVSVGDSWDVTIPKNAMMGIPETTLKAKLVGEKDHNGTACWAINLTGKIPTKVDMAEMMKGQPDPTGQMANMEIFISGTMDMDTEALVAKTGGKAQLVTTKVKTKQTIEIKNVGMSMDMSGDMVMKMSLKN
ncbi:MAG TPA: hypothetical protein PKA27_12060 [Fimbriimonadaceae bacterium]|nr:hypothetical protein [Fimbriimonadaceae bacterium]